MAAARKAPARHPFLPWAPMILGAITAVAFSRVLSYPFLNWDDQDVFLRNDALRAPGLLVWAFTTRYMEHYQPLAWLTWGALERTVGLTPRTAHAVNLVLHVACGALVYVVIHAGLKRRTGARPSDRIELAALVAALVWSLHPLRVEAVAWASAMPYSLALLFALLATIAWITGRHWTAIACFALSLLARPIALGLPIVWLVIGPAPATATAGAALLALLAAIAESSARLTASIAEFGIGPRLTLAASAPWRYLWRTLVPANLTPLDPLALTPRTDLLFIVLGLAGIVLVTAAAWRWRREQPVLAAAWIAYLALLVPAMGLVPSGLQATADRYTYLPAVPLSIALAAIIFRLKPEATLPAEAGSYKPEAILPAQAGSYLVAVMLVGFTTVTWRQQAYWRDSIALWTRAVDLDSRNDVALYNLGTALQQDHRDDEALTKYEQVLELLPGHAEARRNRDVLRARALESEGNRLAASGNLQAALTQYSEAVRLDPRRTHAHAARGMALVELGRLAEARDNLQTAIAQGIDDPAVPNALAYVLMQSGERDAALAVLRDAQRKYPNDPNIARNLAIVSQR